MKFCKILVALAAFQLVGCASIIHGQNQSLSVDTRADTGVVVGATCRLSNNKGEWFITSPGSTTVQRSFEDLSVKCEKDSHAPGVVVAKSSTKGMAFGNILFGGVIGAGVDISTGAAYDYPTLITVVMGESTVMTSPKPVNVSGSRGQEGVMPAAVAASAVPASRAASAPAV